MRNRKKQDVSTILLFDWSKYISTISTFFIQYMNVLWIPVEITNEILEGGAN